MEFHTFSSLGRSALFLSFFGCITTALRCQEHLAVARIASGLQDPVWVGSPSEEVARLFVVEQNSGLIRLIRDGQVLGRPFLDVGALAGQGGEQGLLSMAFHPDYQRNGRFFIHYTNNDGDTRVVEYSVSRDPDVADPRPVQTILMERQPYANHNGGNLAFGPDGMLYIGLGDGGSANDPENRAQDGSTNLGKMLRLDVDFPPRFVPLNNPFIRDPIVNDEIWALGLRNPWRYSFDRLTGDLYIGDVGQSSVEEIDFQPASSRGGENYGWRCMEGSSCTGLAGCSCNDSALALPIYEYDHTGYNCSVIGGFVYRGGAIPWFRGHYVFGDYCSGKVWSFRYQSGHVRDFTERTPELERGGLPKIQSITSFGEDGAGELYIVDSVGGEIFSVVAARL